MDMKSKKKFAVVAVWFATVVGLFFAAFIVSAAWVEPTSNPPAGNTSPPLDTGGTGQSKDGGLILNIGGAPNGLIVLNGNVGVGTAAPSHKLDVHGHQADTYARVEVDDDNLVGWVIERTGANRRLVEPADI